MNAPFQFLCGNAVSPEYLRSLDTPHFTEQHIARFDEETQATVREQQAYLDDIPPSPSSALPPRAVIPVTAE